VGELIAGQRSETPFEKITHPRSFIANFDRLYLPLIAAYYRALDRIR